MTLEQLLVLTSPSLFFLLSSCWSHYYIQSLPCSVPIPGLSPPLLLAPACNVCIHIQAAPLLTLCSVFFFPPHRLSPSWGEEGSTLQEMLFLGGRGLASQKCQNEDPSPLKINKTPLSTGFLLPPLKATLLRHVAPCQGTWNHSMSWACLPVQCWKLGESCLVCMSNQSMSFSCSMCSSSDLLPHVAWGMWWLSM